MFSCIAKMINEGNPTRRERELLKDSSPKSYVRCIACNASSWYFPERKFFRFPKDPERSKEWAIACGKRFLLDISPSDLYKKCRICSAHFVDSDFCTLKKHFLHSRAKPTKFSKTAKCRRTYLNNLAWSRLQLNSPDSCIDREVLIARVKSYPVLYKPLHKDYADVEMKENIWNKIAQELKCASGYKVKEQWLRLRNGYKSALRRQKMEGNGRCKTKKCWAYEKQMEFLLPFVIDKFASTSVQQIADGKTCGTFKEECNVQDQDSSSSSSIITCDNAFNNYYLSERSTSKTSSVTEEFLNESSMISDDRDFGSERTPNQETADEESSGSFKKEPDLQDEDGSSSFRRTLPDHTFHNYHLSELLRPEQIKSEPSSVAEILLDKSSMISEDVDCGSRRISIQGTADEESSGPFQKEHDLQDQQGSSSSRRIIPHHAFHNYHLPGLLRPDQIKSEPSSVTEMPLDKNGMISEDMDCGSRRASVQETTDEQSSAGPLQQKGNLQAQEDSSSLKGIFSTETFHNYLTSKPFKIMQVRSLSTNRSIVESSISDDRDFGSRQTPHQGITDEESYGPFQQKADLQGQEDSSSLRRIVPVDIFHNYFSSKPSRKVQTKSSLSTKRSLGDSRVVSNDRDFRSKNTMNSIYNNEIEKTDALYQFFMSMYYTTKTLPRSLQMKVQKAIFDVVLEEEECVGNI